MSDTIHMENTVLHQSPVITNHGGSIVASQFENLPVAIFTCDTDCYITSFNRAAARLWGYGPEIGKDQWSASFKVFNLDGTPVLPENTPTARTIKTGIPVEGEELILVRSDNTRAIIQPHPQPTYNEAGELSGIINTLIDVTEHYNSENKRAMLAAIIESSEDAIVSKTLDGIITTWNKSAEKMFGYCENEMIGEPISRIIPQNRRYEEDEIISKIKAGEGVKHFETWRTTKGGTEIPVSLTISPILNSKGQVIGASKIARNISRRKQAEENIQRYASNLETLDTVNRMIAEKRLDIQEILQQVTDVTTQVIGGAFGAFFYNQTDDQGDSYMLFTLTGASREVFEKFGTPRNTKLFHPTFTGQSSVRADDITKDPRYGQNAPHYGMPNGHLPVLSYMAVPVIAKTGVVIGTLFYGHPEAGKFTQHHQTLVESVAKQAAIALENAQLYKEIEKANAKKDEFIGLASHELKTPITSLSGYLQLINRRLPATDVNKGFIEKALVQINKLSELISDLLDVSKIETGQLPFSLTSFDLLQLAKEVTDQMQYSTKSHRLVLDVPAGELRVMADRQRIEQVIINLLSNAIKYSPGADEVRISVSFNEDKARMAVQDFGLGIGKEQQERIFSRFYRVEDMAAHISGLGIGLFISKEIIDRHNGNLWVESVLNEGSTFFVEIPLE